jgi:hypothetical protein
VPDMVVMLPRLFGGRDTPVLTHTMTSLTDWSVADTDGVLTHTMTSLTDWSVADKYAVLTNTMTSLTDWSVADKDIPVSPRCLLQVNVLRILRDCHG